MQIKCPECGVQLEDLEGNYFGCPNCEKVWTFADRNLKYVSNLGGFITGEFDGDVNDIMVVGNG
jgi:hypothetical protein